MGDISGVAGRRAGVGTALSFLAMLGMGATSDIAGSLVGVADTRSVFVELGIGDTAVAFPLTTVGTGATPSRRAIAGVGATDDAGANMGSDETWLP